MSEYWLVDLHAHTICSDGLMTVRELLLTAKKRGLSGVAITDHDTTRCVKKALNLAKEIGVIVVPGVEVSTREAHLLLYGIVEELPEKYRLKPSILEVLDYARGNNYFSSIAHPFGRIFKPYPVVYLREALIKADGVEVINGRTPLKNNEKAIRLALEHNKIPTAGSDAHIPEEVGSAKILLREPVENYLQIIEQLYKNNHVVYGGRSLRQIISSIFKKRLRGLFMKKKHGEQYLEGQ